MDSDIEKLDIEMMELKKYVTEESFKLDVSFISYYLK